ncbi:MAG: MucB/RseB C-terminal domain-containing protein [Burkholderiales bacterium]|nr:MucB/RseB C-terminal domain-containing protein [Burkholderiales bacterium]MDE2277093.1 MucB/RseB C-terminal domain-containing protein [Burkholderiales bacterium]
MARAVLRWLSLATFVSSLLPMAAHAGPAPGAAARIDPRAWLARIHAAANQGNYQGVMVFSSGGTMTSSRVWHYAVGDQTYEHLEVQDGRQQRIVRHDNLVQTLWPQAHVAVIERRETLAGWSTTPQQVEPRALEQYELREEGTDRVAGRDAAVFSLVPRDNLRYAQRLWADRATGLLLRDDVIAPAGDGRAAPVVLESTAFSEIDIGVRPQPASVLQAMLDPRHLQGWRVLQPQQQRTTLQAEGWQLARPVPGFELAGCIRRSMEAGESGPVMQTVFSDGLTHVSIFIEPYRPTQHRDEAQARRGATATLILRRGDYWVTTVGDVPPATLRLFSVALERRQP